MKIDELLRVACEKNASDLHFKVGSHPYVRLQRDLKPLDQFARVSSENILGMGFSTMNSRQKQKFRETTELDMAYGVSLAPAVEVVINAEYIRDCIISPDKTHLIKEAISRGTSQYGMQPSTSCFTISILAA